MMVKLNRPAWIIYTPLIVCILIMLPRLYSPQFGLFDDGYTLQTVRQIASGETSLLSLDFERENGRFQPVYWLYQVLLYRVSGYIPIGYYLGNTVLLIFSTFFIIYQGKNFAGSLRQAWATGLVFSLAGPIIENYYTISKSEPLQLLFILFGVYLAWQCCHQESRWGKIVIFIGICLAVSFACAVKETALILIPISGIWLIISKFESPQELSLELENMFRVLFIACVIGVAIYYSTRFILIGMSLTSGSYTYLYQFKWQYILLSFLGWSGWLLRDFSFLIPMFIFLLVYTHKSRNQTDSRWFVYCLVWLVGWLVIYLPWILTPEYYLLPLSLGVAVLAGWLFEIMINKGFDGILGLRKFTWVCFISALFLWSFSLNANYINARIQLISDRANAELMGFLATQLPRGSTLLVNYPKIHEYIVEMRLHLSEIYHRDDLIIIPLLETGFNDQIDSNHTKFIASTELKLPLSNTVRFGIPEKEAIKRDQLLNSLVRGKGNSIYHSGYQFRACFFNIRSLRFLIFCPIYNSRKYSSLIYYGWKVLELHQ